MTLVTDLTSRKAATEAPLIDPLADRWSPRAFDPDAVVETETLRTVLEAARWAPSANNSQPWRFIVARRGTAAFATIHDAMAGFNKEWADSAAVLIVNIAETTDAEGRTRPWARYDLGQAVAHLTVQAQHEGLHTHQMGGFEAQAIHDAFELPDTQEVVSITTLGRLGDVDQLNEVLRERELAPRQRMELGEFVTVGA